LLDFSNSYTGPGSKHVAPNSFDTAETRHKKLVDTLYHDCKRATKASFEGVCRRYVDWCASQPQIQHTYKFFAYPADTIEAFLESERLRHLEQGNQPGLNVANANTEIHRLSEIQGCPAFTQIEIDLMKSAVGRARHDRMQTQLSAEPDLAETKANRDVLTNADSDKLLRVCAETVTG